ncbi:ephrin type-A receptor 3-like [Argopecten irradians]|uniref:ephrin type-A receptor 3-like n=1 Tax=Argopecten irradians TaxID=31199 RepID=UPI003715D604
MSRHDRSSTTGGYQGSFKCDRTIRPYQVYHPSTSKASPPVKSKNWVSEALERVYGLSDDNDSDLMNESEVEDDSGMNESELRQMVKPRLKMAIDSEKETLCVIEDFREMFSVSCEMSIVIANVIGFGVFVILVIFVLVVIKFRFDKKMRSTHDRMKELGLLSQDFSCLSLDEWEIRRDNVVLNRKLGEGAFGTVFGGETYQEEEGWVPVAVKTLKIGSRVEEKIDFLTESEIMKRFSHPNIVKLLGVCTRGEPVLAIMEYHLHGWHHMLNGKGWTRQLAVLHAGSSATARNLSGDDPDAPGLPERRPEPPEDM